jgi:hypothetical protein
MDISIQSGGSKMSQNKNTKKIQHKTNGDDDANLNTNEYPTGDDHPSPAGNQKAAAEFVPLLNCAYNVYASVTPVTNLPTPTPTQETQLTPTSSASSLDDTITVEARQIQRPPSNPNVHVGGELFAASKAIIVAPYLMALFSVIAVAAVVVKRKRI